MAVLTTVVSALILCLGVVAATTTVHIIAHTHDVCFYPVLKIFQSTYFIRLGCWLVEDWYVV